MVDLAVEAMNGSQKIRLKVAVVRVWKQATVIRYSYRISNGACYLYNTTDDVTKNVFGWKRGRSTYLIPHFLITGVIKYF